MQHWGASAQAGTGLPFTGQTVPIKVPAMFVHKRISMQHGCPMSQFIATDIDGAPAASPMLGPTSPLSDQAASLPDSPL